MEVCNTSKVGISGILRAEGGIVTFNLLLVCAWSVSNGLSNWSMQDMLLNSPPACDV